MQKKFKKILVVCVANMTTGGPEALHHLVHCMRQIGLPAHICYEPFEHAFEVPEPYRNFDISVSTYDDASENLIIFPELYPMEALRVKHADAAIWWLSLDNFLERRHTSAFHDKIRYFKRAVQGRKPFGGMKSLRHLIHFTQSHYAGEYLKQLGIPYYELFEPINARFLDPQLNTGVSNRIDEVIFNPAKGMAVTQRLINANPGVTFTPLQGFNRIQLTEKFQTAKVYIDFGHHPGRDRLPREAAIHGCCIMTGQLGAAKNDIDIPIPDFYKIDQKEANFIDQFNSRLQDIFDNFENHHLAFSSYRNRILSESEIFQNHIKNIFES